MFFFLQGLDQGNSIIRVAEVHAGKHWPPTSDDFSFQCSLSAISLPLAALISLLSREEALGQLEVGWPHSHPSLPACSERLWLAEGTMIWGRVPEGPGGQQDSLSSEKTASPL